MSYPMLGTRIVLDEEKILREGKYDLEKMYAAIDEMAQNSGTGLIKKDKYTYICKGDEHSLADLGIFTMRYLVEIEWFTLNVKEWLWLSEKEGDSDMIDFFKKEGEGIWQ